MYEIPLVGLLMLLEGIDWTPYPTEGRQAAPRELAIRNITNETIRGAARSSAIITRLSVTTLCHEDDEGADDITL